MGWVWIFLPCEQALSWGKWQKKFGKRSLSPTTEPGHRRGYFLQPHNMLMKNLAKLGCAVVLPLSRSTPKDSVNDNGICHCGNNYCLSSTCKDTCLSIRAHTTHQFVTHIPSPVSNLGHITKT